MQNRTVWERSIASGPTTKILAVNRDFASRLNMADLKNIACPTIGWATTISFPLIGFNAGNHPSPLKKWNNPRCLILVMSP